MATSPNYNWPEPDNTDLVKNGALAIRTAVDAIDSSLAELKGGTTGQVLSKTSNTDMDFTWVAQDDSNAIQNAIVDAKGDIIVATAADTPARLGVGSNGQVLKANSATATGLEWASDSAGMTNPMTTTGDTIYSSSGSTPARLGIGTTGQVLTVASGIPSWATPAGGSFSGVRVSNSADLTINNTTSTAVGFNTESFDSDAFHDNSTNNSRLTIPTGKTGYYQISAMIRWKNIIAPATVRQLRFFKNGTQQNVYPIFWSQNDDTYQVYSDLLSLSAGDYIEIYVWQNSGSSTLVLADSSFSIAKVG